MAFRLASPGPGNSGPYLGIIGTLFLYMAYRLASHGAGERGWHLASHIHGDTAPPWAQFDLVILVLTWSSPVPGNPGHHLGITWTW